MKLSMFISKGLKPSFDKEVVDVANAFEIFLNHYYRSRGVTTEIINYYNSLHLAKMDYQSCATLKYFSEEDCLLAWA